MSNPSKNELNDEEWELVLKAIPELNQRQLNQHFRPLLNSIDVNNGNTLPADGLYVVLNGQISLRLNDQEIAVARQSNYFYEEYLLLDDLNIELSAVTITDSQIAFLSRGNWDTLTSDIKKNCLTGLFGDLINVYQHEFQQPINSCNITAAALSLTALGFPTEVDDIFKSCALPVSYVVNDLILSSSKEITRIPT